MEFYGFNAKLANYIRFFVLKYQRVSILSLNRKLSRFAVQSPHKDIINFNEDIIDMISDSDIVYADKALHNKIWFFNKEFDLGEKIRWDFDYISGFEWKKGKHYSEYIQENLSNNADVKFPREISRCHHFLLLGQAFIKTRKLEYYHKFKSDILNWIECNPFMFSINWGCTQDVAIRAVNWIWAFFFFEDEIKREQSFFDTFKTALYQHGFFVYWNPEDNGKCNSNHYLGDLVGLIYCGLFFDNKQSQEWLQRGVSEFFKEVRFQFLPSGPSYEKSINYNRLVMEFVFSTVALLTNNGIEIPQDILYRMNKMLDFVKAYRMPDGLVPNIGDQDDARLHPFTIQNNLNHDYLLGMGYYLLKRQDFEIFKGDAKKENALMQLDRHYLQDDYSTYFYKCKPIQTLKIESSAIAFEDAGFYIIKESSNYMFINVSGKGKYPELSCGGHTHSDLLSFVLYLEDKSFLVDSGSYIYTADPEQRMLFRSTKMHNTLVVDKQNQNTINKEILWDFDRDAIPLVRLWVEDEEKVVFIGEHNGYNRLPEPVTHVRMIEYYKHSKTWKITDTATGAGKHEFEINFHFDVGIYLDIDDRSAFTKCKTGSDIQLEFETNSLIDLKVGTNFISKSYGTKEQAQMLTVTTTTNCPFKITTIIKRK